jgi:rhodanese-related sulfurtransferase
MKAIFLSLAGIVLLTVAAGTAYTLAAGKIEFFPPATLYDKARICTPSTKAESSPAPVPAPAQEAVSAAAGATMAAGGVAVAPGEPPKTLPEKPAQPAPAAEAAKPGEAPRIQHDEAVDFWQNDFLFVDARRSKDYEEGHIPGALSISAWEPGMGEKINKLLALQESQQLPPVVIVYCSRSKDCEDSQMIASQLKAAGFAEIHVYEGGFPEWKEKGMPIALGKEPGRRGT